MTSHPQATRRALLAALAAAPAGAAAQAAGTGAGALSGPSPTGPGMTVARLAAAAPGADAILAVSGYHAIGDGGGGLFAWDPATARALHDGGTVIDPARRFPGDWNDQRQLAAWFAAGTAGGSGAGVWRRLAGGREAEAVWFGLRGDYDPQTGTGSDDVLPINQALARFHTVRLPPRNVLIRSRSIDQALRHAGSVLEGSGGGKVYGARSGTVLWGETGDYPVIDRMGSQRAAVRNLAICSGLRTPSRCGVADRRATVSPYAQFNVLDNVDIDIASAPGAYRGRGSIGWLNHSAELATVVAPCYWKADTAFAFTATDLWAVPSQFATQGGPPSTSALTIHGPLACHSYHPVGRPFRLHNAASVDGVIFTNNETRDGAVVPGTRGFSLSGGNFAHDLVVFAEGCEKKGEIEFLDSVRLRVRGIFGPGSNLVATGRFQEVIRSDILFEPTAHGSVAQTYWVEGPVGDAWRDSRIVAPVAPRVDFIRARTRENLTFIARGLRRETMSRVSYALPTFADNAAALSGGLEADEIYKTPSGELRIVV